MEFVLACAQGRIVGSTIAYMGDARGQFGVLSTTAISEVRADSNTGRIASHELVRRTALPMSGGPRILRETRFAGEGLP